MNSSPCDFLAFSAERHIEMYLDRWTLLWVVSRYLTCGLGCDTQESRGVVWGLMRET